MSWAAIAGPVAGAVVGGYLGYKGAKANAASQSEANAINAAAAKENIEHQKEFAKHGIQWKVEDAKAAGIHPLAALGANTVSFSPVHVGAQGVDAGGGMQALGNTVANMGQDIGRAVSATQTQQQKVLGSLQLQSAQLNVEHSHLQNELLRSQLAKQNAQIGPPLPSNSDMPLLTGQGNSFKSMPSNGTYVEENPLQRIHSQPGRPAQEVGAVTDYGYVRTPKGLAIVPSKDVKEKIEDQMIPEAMWALRNQLLPNFGMGPEAPDPKYYPLPKGADAWKWHHIYQEYRPARYISKNRKDHVFLD